MTQPRAQQIKDLKTKHSLPTMVTGAYPSAGASSSTMTAGNSITFRTSTVTQVVDGCQQSLPAVVIGTTLEPFTVPVGPPSRIVDITLPGVFGGLPIPVTFQATDFVQIGGVGVWRLTAERAATRINADLAAAPYFVTYPVASNHGGYLQLVSALGANLVVGDAASITISDNAGFPGIVTALGFGAVGSVTGTGLTAPTRGILTKSLDEKGGLLPFRYTDGSTVLTEVASLLSFGGINQYNPNITPGKEIYGRITWNPVTTSFTIKSYAENADPFPSIITSQGTDKSDFFALTGTTFTIVVNDNVFPSITVPVTPGIINTAQDLVDDINQAWHSVTEALTPFHGAGRASIISSLPEPYNMDGSDDFYIKIEGVSYHITTAALTGRISATAVAAAINGIIAASGACIVHITSGINYIQVYSNNTSASQIDILPGDVGAAGTNIRTLNKLGISVGIYTGSTLASVYGGSEIQFKLPGTAAGTISAAVPATMVALGLSAGAPVAVPLATGEGSVLMPSPVGASHPVHYLIPEVMEFGEVPQNTDDIEQKFSIPNVIQDANSLSGLTNQGRVPFLGSDGKIDARLVQNFFDTLSGNEVTLGAKLVGTAAGALQARIKSPFRSTPGEYTLIWESSPAPTVVEPSLRIYSNSNGLVFTNNARWDGAAWNKDAALFAATRLEILAGAISVSTFASVTAGPWSDAAWTEDPLTVNAPEYATTDGMVKIASKSLGSGATAIIPRINVPYADTLAAPAGRTLISQSAPGSGIGQVYRVYIDNDGGKYETWNAKWDGAAAWSKDDAAQMAYCIHTLMDGAAVTITEQRLIRPQGSAGAWNDTITAAGWIELSASSGQGVASTNGQNLFGTLTLGKDSGVNESGYNIPRLTSVPDSTGPTRTLMWLMLSTGNFTRVYYNFTDQLLEVTTNCEWSEAAGGRWTADAGAVASKFIFSQDGFELLTHTIASGNPWTDGNYIAGGWNMPYIQAVSTSSTRGDLNLGVYKINLIDVPGGTFQNSPMSTMPDGTALGVSIPYDAGELRAKGTVRAWTRFRVSGGVITVYEAYGINKIELNGSAVEITTDLSFTGASCTPFIQQWDLLSNADPTKGITYLPGFLAVNKYALNCFWNINPFTSENLSTATHTVSVFFLGA